MPYVEWLQPELPDLLKFPIDRQLFAFIVSIDEYILTEKFRRLRGCVNDGTAMQSFLTQKLKVPENHIKFLKNGDATRDAIITTFNEHLINNADIQDGDAILVFYTGHGCKVEAPRGWSAGDMVEAICSYDAETSGGQNNLIHVIPDRTLGALLRELASKKGNNIVRHVLADCPP
jgi:hypothetical protein